MKRVIREGVFETNSSSTHSVVFKRKTSNEVDKDSSYEIHTPLAKTLFLIGLITYVRKYGRITPTLKADLFDFNNPTIDKWRELVGPTLLKNNSTEVCERFKLAVIDEYIQSSGITLEEFNKQFNESPFTRDGECLCCNFFENDVLNFCRCPFDSFNGMVNAFQLINLENKEDYRAKAKEYLSNEFKFALKEFYCGVAQIGKGEII